MDPETLSSREQHLRFNEGFKKPLSRSGGIEFQLKIIEKLLAEHERSNTHLEFRIPSSINVTLNPD